MKTLCLFLALTAFAGAQNVLDPTWVSSTTAGTVSNVGTSIDCTVATSCVWLVGPTWALSVKVVISGTFAGTLQFESATDGKTWGSVTTTTGVSSATGPGTFYVQIPQVPCFRVRATSLTSGKAQIALTALNYVPVISAGTGGGTSTPTLVWSKYIITVTGGYWVINGIQGPALGAGSPIQTLTLFTTATRTVFHAALLKTITPFAISGTLTATTTLGTTTAVDALMQTGGDTFDPTQAVSLTNFYLAGGVKMIDFANDVVAFTINTSGTSPSLLIAGSMECDFLTSVMP